MALRTYTTCKFKLGCRSIRSQETLSTPPKRCAEDAEDCRGAKGFGLLAGLGETLYKLQAAIQERKDIPVGGR